MATKKGRANACEKTLPFNWLIQLIESLALSIPSAGLKGQLCTSMECPNWLRGAIIKDFLLRLSYYKEVISEDFRTLV